MGSNTARVMTFIIRKIHTNYKTEVTPGVGEWKMERQKEIKDLDCF